jgi:hypothetical protein
VNLFTGEGLQHALEGAQVVVDTSTPPYTDYEGAAEYFEAATLNWLTPGAMEGATHHVVLSVLGMVGWLLQAELTFKQGRS